MHWASRYIGKKWTDEHDCFYWFRLISKEIYNRDVPEYKIDHERMIISSSRAMSMDILHYFGYKQVEFPAEGDAVFLSQRNRPHHVGMVVIICGVQHVLHAVTGAGIILSDMMDIRNNGWKIRSYWTYAN